MQIIWLFITYFGSFWWLFPVTVLLVIYLILQKKTNNALLLAMTMMTSPIISNTLKNIFKEIRPINNLENSYSFPSGHSLNSMVFYLLVIYIFKIKNKYFIWGIILFVGLSRIVLGVHYYWDVLGGWLIGYAIYRISIKLLK